MRLFLSNRTVQIDRLMLMCDFDAHLEENQIPLFYLAGVLCKTLSYCSNTRKKKQSHYLMLKKKKKSERGIFFSSSQDSPRLDFQSHLSIHLCRILPREND